MIEDITLSEIYNSCKEKTIKVSIKNENGTFSASPPSGTSKGKYEAKTLDIKTIKKSFPKIKKRLIGKREIEVDKIIEKIGIEKIGANFSIALSIAAIKAITKNEPYKFFKNEAEFFPFPLGNTIGGGAHSGYLSEQEILVLPLRAKTIKEAIKTNLSIWKETEYYLKPFITGRNKENAWMCKLNDLKTLEILTNIAEAFEARVGIDFAANNIYKDGRYYYLHPDRNFSAEDQLEFVLNLIKTYKLIYVEDPFHENDFENFSELTKKARCLIAGDDLFATQPSRLKLGIRKKAGNAIIIKPNQAGNIFKTLETVKIAKKANYTTVVSHRSCETNDNFIADLVVGIESPIIKCGIYGKERTSKLDRLVEIWNKTKKPKMAKLRKIFI
jgi:enolase